MAISDRTNSRQSSFQKRRRQAPEQARRKQQHGAGQHDHELVRPVHQGELVDDFLGHRDDTLLFDREAEQLTGLAQRNADGNTVEEADQDRPQQEVRQHIQLEEAGGDAEQPREQRQQRWTTQCRPGRRRRPAA
jgi:hypothetical protein